MANVSRSLEQKNVTCDGELTGMVSKVKGTLMENIDEIVLQLNKSCSTRQQQHLSALLSVAEHLVKNGPIVATQMLAEVYRKAKNVKNSYLSAVSLSILSRHLNIIQVYHNNKAFILENRGTDVEKVINSIENTQKSEQEIVNKNMQESIGDTFNAALNYMDSKRDRDTMKAIISKITSVKNVMKISNVQDGCSIKRSKGTVFANLKKFETLKSKIASNVSSMGNLSEEQQKQKVNRLLQKEKVATLRHVYEGRGRTLKCEEFTDLAGILEFAFGDADRVFRAGGGLESHPRLTDAVLYRAADNNTIMRQARETVLALSPEHFQISLSSCFNYTQNYREGTLQSKRHHKGKGINACISLHKPPRTGVEKHVINLHWTTQNVNVTLDMAHFNSDNVMVDSKDAKAAIQSDVSPVQKPGKTWKKIELPDHDWQRSTYNTITLMTHLFLKTDAMYLDDGSISIRRTGTAATTLSLTFFEPHTVQQLFNDFFLLLVNPSLDSSFRNPQTGKLKEHFVFIVDNGPAEAPSSSLVAMWLVRLARLLQLKSITQKSFAEYHSKRNPVERVHAVHNTALSNEVFSSHGVHDKHVIGDERHHDNMEHMAQKVQQCLQHTQYGGSPCTVQRGLGRDVKLPFDDEETLTSFLRKSEKRKDEDGASYCSTNGSVLDEVALIWGINANYVGSYREDYQILQNTYHEEGRRTCWFDKYTRVVYNPDCMSQYDEETRELQPIPDYVRWLETGGELHYLPFEKLQNLKTYEIDGTPGVFLPSKILEMAFKVFHTKEDSLLKCVSLVAWCPMKEISRFFDEYEEKLEETYECDKEREYWSQHELYMENTKGELQNMAIKNKLPMEGRKHEIVKRLVEELKLEKPGDLELYYGSIQTIPYSVKELTKLTVYQLKDILKAHNMITCGTKDELVLRVGMLKAGRPSLAFKKEHDGITNLIILIRRIIKAQKEMYLCDPTTIYKRRKYKTPSYPKVSASRPRDRASALEKKEDNLIPVPAGIGLQNLEDVLELFTEELTLIRRSQKDSTRIPEINVPLNCELIGKMGTRVKVLWTKNEIGNTGWRPGWFIGTVQTVDTDSDTIKVEFDTEPGKQYSYAIEGNVASGKLKLAKQLSAKLSEYQMLTEIGAVVDMFWTEEELGDTGWTKGWYTAEVQAFDYDDDEFELVFEKEPEEVYSFPVVPSLVKGILRLHK